MDESEEPRRPAPPPGGLGKPLPRLWKHEPDEDELREQKELEEKRKKAKAEAEAPLPPVRKEKPRKKKAEKDAGKSGKKGALVEETPDLDTYEARQRVRIALGAAFVAVFVFVGVVLYRTFAPDSPAEDEVVASSGRPATSVTGPVPGGVSPVKMEAEARVILDKAREVAKNGNPTLAMSMLKRVTASYASTKAAVEAKEALGRPAQNLPLFLDRPAVVATPEPGKEPAKTAPAPGEAPVVQVSPTQVAVAKGAEASLVLPANAAEPLAPGAGGVPPMPAVAAGAGAGPPARPLPKGFYTRPGTRVLASGWPVEIVGARDGAPMVLVPGGRFVQGRDGGDPSEAPAHQASVSTFYVDQHEVTVHQLALFQKEAGRRTERDRALAREPTNAQLDADDSRPAVFVSARDAADFAAWAGKRLPTEAQWEAAARSPDGRLFPWGNAPGTPRADRKMRAVMTEQADRSPCGAFDLAGNAWEWTKDWYDPKYYQLFRTTPAENPVGPAEPRSKHLVVKGGSAEGMVTSRKEERFDVRLPYLGFRCVLPVEGPDNAFETRPPGVPGTSGAPAGSGGGSAVPF